jgi:type I restriction-modification system DNA methylase subunit
MIEDKDLKDILYTHTEISSFARVYYRFIQLPGSRKALIKKIEQGIDQSKLGTNFVIDKKKDEFSLKKLQDWKNLSKEERLDFCQWLVDDGSEAIMYANQKKEDLKDKFKSKADIRRFWRGK